MWDILFLYILWKAKKKNRSILHKSSIIKKIHIKWKLLEVKTLPEL